MARKGGIVVHDSREASQGPSPQPAAPDIPGANPVEPHPACDADTARAYIERVVTVYADLILRLSYARLGSSDDAQDICQTVLLKLLDASKGGAVQFRNAEHEKAWVIRATINACIDLRRSAWCGRVDSLDELRERDGFEPVESVAASEPDPSVLAAVSALSPAYRQAIYLHYYEGYSARDIATLTGEREGTVAKHLSRARAKLRTLLEGGSR